MKFGATQKHDGQKIKLKDIIKQLILRVNKLQKTQILEKNTMK